MTHLATDTSLDFVDWSNPVNWDHSLNRGLIEWWLAVPGTRGFGSVQWRGLCNRYVGTLTNMDSKTDWLSTSRIGGMGNLDFDGTDDYVDAGNAPDLTFGTGQSFSYSLWFNQKKVQYGWTGLVYHGVAGESQGHIGFQFSTRYLSGGTGDGVNWQTNSSAYVPTVGDWVHAVLTLDRVSNVMKLYADSVEVGSFGHSHVPTPTSLGLRIGEGNAGSERFDGFIDNVRIFNRALTAVEVREEYRLSRLGLMGLLNTIWMPDQSRILASFQPAWAARSTTIAGVPAGA